MCVNCLLSLLLPRSVALRSLPFLPCTHIPFPFPFHLSRPSHEAQSVLVRCRTRSRGKRECPIALHNPRIPSHVSPHETSKTLATQTGVDEEIPASRHDGSHSVLLQEQQRSLGRPRSRATAHEDRNRSKSLRKLRDFSAMLTVVSSVTDAAVGR